MAVAKTKLETFVSPDEMKEVILDFEKYPQFLPEVARVEVKERSEGAAIVTFYVALSFGGFDIQTEYTVRYAIEPNEIRWTLVSSPSVTKNEGCWKLEETDDGETVADYEAVVETNLAVPPDVQALFVEESLPKLMMRFRDRAEDM
jgi:ribosome-associated toxin RatA of RatAB toxin-antitoxin module